MIYRITYLVEAEIEAEDDDEAAEKSQDFMTALENAGSSSDVDAVQIRPQEPESEDDDAFEDDEEA